MTALLLYGLLALLAPYALFALVRRSDRVVFQGDVTVSTIGLLPRERSAVTAYDFITAFLPGGGQLTLEVSTDRLAKIRGDVVTRAFITVCQPLFGPRYVSSTRWAGESAPDKGETRNGATYLSAVYLLLGMFSAGYVYTPDVVAAVGHWGNILPVMLLALSGWVIATDKLPAVSADSQTRFLNLIPMGRGHSGLFVSALLAAAITAVCFWYGGLLVFIGLSTGMALGMFAALLAKPAVGKQTLNAA